MNSNLETGNLVTTSQIFQAGAPIRVWILGPVDQPFDYCLGDEPAQIGSIVQVPFGNRQRMGVIWGPATGEYKSLKTIISLPPMAPMRQPMRDFLSRMADYTITPLGQVLAMALRTPPAPPKPVLYIQAVTPYDAKSTRKRRALWQHLCEQGRPINPRDLDFSKSIIDGLIADGGAQWINAPAKTFKILPSQTQLSPAQETALNQCHQSQIPTVLKGVTGAGKTEIYLELAADALTQGKQVLIMLPEIALTQTFVERIKKRFGFTPAHWHSDMSTSARRRIWHHVASGEIPIVVGARSALFLPFKKLGLIVVDEEHDRGYKQDEGVIYNARDMAVLRAKLEGAKLLLASATPSVESMINAQKGKYQRVDLNERFGKAILPQTRIVDMREAGLDRQHWISPEMISAITQRIADHEQSLLFLNRRGFAPLLLCRACGHQMGCPDCDTRLVAHAHKPRLMCHQCGYQCAQPVTCPECNVEGQLVPIGPGVERIAAELRATLPDARVCVLSSDTASGGEILAEFDAIAAGEYDVVIGTQMVAKGHHFPNLTLVGIIDADIGLEGADLRAAEGSFQMLRQVTGRAGRAQKPGEALVQSYQPDHPILRAILDQDDSHFYRDEIARRTMANAPPFSRYVAVVISSPDWNEAMQAGRDFLRLGQNLSPKGVQIMGPAPAPIARIRGRYRVRLLVKMPRDLSLHDALRTLRMKIKPNAKLRIALDVDPLNFL